MKKRIISAIVLLAIIIPLVVSGGMLFNIGVYIVSVLALKEFLDIKAVRKKLPIFIQLIAYIFLTLIVLVDVRTKSMMFTLDYRILAALFMSFLIPTVFYHERQIYSVTDAFYMIGGLLFLSISMSLLIIVRNISLSILLFLILIPIITDTFAYISGSLIGKNKLLEEISPNKTVEGMIVGTVMSVFVSSIFFHTVVDPLFSKVYLIFICLFLSIVGQLGDLVFSAIKRYFGKKDFSNIIPGHGGILDRLDSVIFVILGFIFFTNIIGG
ncbi:MAG: phosphatidate cytidylyltransferase [Bacilli bacterium]|nr:phosphatidate cytidylyltransferase [Bacilli bacterium]